MIELTCQNKQCKHIMHTSTDKKVYQCPICGRNIYNWVNIINENNWLYIETMVKNIETYGTNTLKMIDQCYTNAITRLRIRQTYFKTLEDLKENE